MPGMNSGVNVNDPIVIAAFKSALLHQGIIALLIFAVLGFAWLTIRAWLPAAQPGDQAGPGGSPAAAQAEPAWRQLLRIGFGLLWVFDGILQAQPKMAIGLPSQVIEPIAGELAALGAAPGELGRDHLVLSPPAGRGVGGVDPDRDRHLAAGRAAGRLVPAGRPGQRRLGAGGLGVRGVLRRGLRPRPDVAVRRPRRRAHLLRGRRADRAARSGCGATPGSGRPSCPGWACSWSPWRCCRPGRDADSGRGSPTGSRAPWPA